MDNHKEPNLRLSFSKSTNLREAVYDPFMRVLTINFISGGEYDYLNVEKSLFYELKESPSPGRFFHSNIRGKFDFFKRKGDKKEKNKS